MINLSAPFLRRPVGATLLGLALLLVGFLAYPNLPVSSLPWNFPPSAFRSIGPALIQQPWLPVWQPRSSAP